MLLIAQVILATDQLLSDHFGHRQQNHLALRQNYQLLDEKFKNQSLTEHYKTSRPYSRFFKKCYQYTVEFFSTLLIRSPKKILDNFYKKLSTILVLLELQFELMIADF